MQRSNAMWHMRGDRSCKSAISSSCDAPHVARSVLRPKEEFADLDQKAASMSISLRRETYCKQRASVNVLELQQAPSQQPSRKGSMHSQHVTCRPEAGQL